MCQGIVLDTNGNDIDEKDTILNFKDLMNTLCDVLSNIRITWSSYSEVARYYRLLSDSVDMGWDLIICTCNTCSVNVDAFRVTVFKDIRKDFFMSSHIF